MQHNKTAHTHLFLLSLTKCQHEKNIEKAFFISAGPQNESETAGSGVFTKISIESKKKFPVKFIFT